MRWSLEYFFERSKRSLVALLTFTLAFAPIALANADKNPQHGTGLNTLTDAEIQYIEENWPHLVSVKVNKVGAHRINEHLETNHVKADRFPIPDTSSEDELITVKGSAKHRQSLGIQSLAVETLDPIVLPRHVDNSLLPSFPTVGNQGSNGACAAWGTTYYQATHEIGLLNGVNNKISQEGVLSPKWTYDILNHGQDAGLTMLQPYGLLSQNGAISITRFPYDKDYLAWDLNPQDWIDALNNRTTDAIVVDGVDGTPEQLQLVKQYLNNGHVLTVGTWAYSWQMTKVGVDSSSPSNPYAGQQAIHWMKGKNGGHCVTIVGYDDDIWIDVNGDGKVDAGEKGAFLVVNQWNTDWGNNGFIWVSYDAFKAKSAVKNGPSADRTPFADITNSQLLGLSPKALHYKPKLIGQFTLNQTLRNQITILTGISTPSEPGPSKTTVMNALNRSGGAMEFDGKNPETVTSMTFVTDFTDMIASTGASNAQRFYLLLADNALGSPTSLTKFSLIDVIRQNQVDCPGLPVSCDNAMTVKFIDYDMSLPIPDDLPTVAIASPANGTVLSGTVQVVVQARSTLGISHVDFFVNDKLVDTATNAPYLFTVDASKLTGDKVVFKAVAYDQKQQKSETSVSYSLTQPNVSFFINSGGPALINAGVNWSADGNFSGTSSTATSMFPFVNKVYGTQRMGTFAYNVPVANGKYTVRLKFADLFARLSGDRTTNVSINNNLVISNLNLFRQFGFGAPYDRDFIVTVTDGKITIQFTPSNLGGVAVINAIAITPIN